MEIDERSITLFMHTTSSLKEVPTKTSLPTNRRSSLSSPTWVMEKPFAGERTTSKHKSNKPMDFIPGLESSIPHCFQGRLPQWRWEGRIHQKTRQHHPRKSNSQRICQQIPTHSQQSWTTNRQRHDHQNLLKGTQPSPRHQNLIFRQETWHSWRHHYQERMVHHRHRVQQNTSRQHSSSQRSTRQTDGTTTEFSE